METRRLGTGPALGHLPGGRRVPSGDRGVFWGSRRPNLDHSRVRSMAGGPVQVVEGAVEGGSHREVDGFLAAIEEFFGARVARTWTTAESAAWLVARYKWWRKPYKEHRTGQLPYAPNPTGLTRTVSFIGAEDRIRAQYGDPGVLCWKWAAQLPGIDRKADQVVARFLTGKRMALANYEDWIGIDGIGEITANRAIHEIRGPENATE